MASSFIWTDLSTFDLAEAKRFYAAVLGWEYFALDDGYLGCFAATDPSAGLYEMPDRFRQIGMPSFWMSYIAVADVVDTVASARAAGAIIEVEPQAAQGGTIALIRDPAGAGFTCYEGDDRAAAPEPMESGRRVWHELHISRLEVVQPFYEVVFGWRVRPTSERDRYEFVSADGAVVAGVRVTPNEFKGDKEYWGVYFGVRDLDQAEAHIAAAGGTSVVRHDVGARTGLLAMDSQGAALHLLDIGDR